MVGLQGVARQVDGAMGVTSFQFEGEASGQAGNRAASVGLWL